MNKSYLNSLHAEVASKRETRKTELAFDVQKLHAIDDTAARMAIRIETPYQSRVTEEAMASAVAARFPGVRYMPNSIHRTSQSDRRLFGIFVERNVRTMSMDTAGAEIASSGMTQINDTVYQDANDAIWTVQKDGEHSYLVSQVEDNISTLIGGLQTRALATASASLSMEEDFGRGSAILFYDREKAELAFGIAADGIKVYNTKRDKMQNVEAAYVVVVDDANKTPVEETASTKADLLAYMKMLYSQNPAFYAQIAEIVNKHVSV